MERWVAEAAVACVLAGKVNLADELTTAGKAKGKILQPKDLKKNKLLPTSGSPSLHWAIVNFTDKTATIRMFDDETKSFKSKKYSFRWDGTGYKRQGEYLREDGLG